MLRSHFGMDLNTAAIHRTNLPRIRYSDPSDDLKTLAKAFGAPVVIQADFRAGTLRQAAKERGVEVLLYKAGEALRFDEFSIRIGVRGILSVMRELDMLPKRAAKSTGQAPVLSRSSYWLRASVGGILRTHKTIGDMVGEGEVAGYLSDPFGKADVEVRIPDAGLMIGRTNLPVINQGDALLHIARIHNISIAEDRFGKIEEEIETHPLFDGCEAPCYKPLSRVSGIAGLMFDA